MKNLFATIVSILLILTFSVNVSAKDFDTPEIPLYPNSYVAGITPKSTAGIDNENNLIYGIKPNLTNLSEYLDVTKSGVSLNYSTSTIGTGTKVYVMQGGSVIGTFEAVIFGDINGDSTYNGMDAVIVRCLASGMLTKAQVGTAQYTAADCNHDGVVDDSDVELLQQAGVLLTNIDQNKTQEKFQTSSAYTEHLHLIDQTTKTVDMTEEESEETEPVVNPFKAIIDFFKEIIAIINAAIKFINAGFPGLPFGK